MKTSILLLFFICKFTFSFNVCPSSIGVPNGVFERDSAAFYPNDEVALTADGKQFIPYKYVPGQRANEISTCAAYTCGRKTFPHGFNIHLISKKPLMLCENHRCLNPDKIKCRKTIEYGACINENEWVAGLIERKNETKEWLEIECCHYLDDREPVFVKNIIISSTYNHDIVLENGTMIATDYIKDIKKVKNISGKTVFSASIYRMKCDTKNIPEKVPSIFDKAEELKDEDGIGFFEVGFKNQNTANLKFII
uniref:Uncharacterized protein n=1 Tax=Panagrolaimus davidi TaxID=227884 RepID=A0A914Q309_9BILA